MAYLLLWITAVVQALFYLATGVWSILDIESFERVTGPKTDLWLVRTVGLLVAVTGLVLLLAAVRRRITAEIVVLAMGNALVLAIVDVTYVALGRIPSVYLLDAAAEALLIAGWLAGLLAGRRRIEVSTVSVDRADSL